MNVAGDAGLRVVLDCRARKSEWLQCGPGAPFTERRYRLPSILTLTASTFCSKEARHTAQGGDKYRLSVCNPRRKIVGDVQNNNNPSLPYEKAVLNDYH